MSKSNGPVAKLREKEKARVLKLKCGNFKGVYSYCMKNRSVTSPRIDLQEIEDAPGPKPVPTMAQVVCGEVKLKRGVLVMKADWKPEPYTIKPNRSARRALLRA